MLQIGAFGVLDQPERALGIEIGKLDGMQKRLPGHIVRFAHYDPEKLRPRS